jgi:hypothetical protein
MIPHSEFVALLRRDIDQAQAEIAEPLVRGNAENFEEYARWTGKIAGLKQAREILDDLVKRSNEGTHE